MSKLPARLGNYRLTRQLHVGAQTEVWQAMTVDMNEPRVLKIQSPKHQLASEVARRLKHEYAVAGGLKHRNMIRMMECGVDQGLTYLTLERFASRSLRQVITDKDRATIEGQLPLIADQCCAALHHLHQAGWVYAGLKPTHQLLNEEIQLRLIDFSVAVPLRKGWRRLHAGSSKLIGSPYYFSPEQIRRQPLDQRSDVYSLGCWLYELIEGRVPFTGATAQVLLSKHLQHKPPRLTARSKFVTDALAELIITMLAKEPAQRPEDMLIVRHELRRVFELADPGEWQTQFGGVPVDDDAQLGLAARSAAALQATRLAAARAGPGAQPSRWAVWSRGTRKLAARTVQRRSVQFALALSVLALVGWIMRGETFTAEQSVLTQYQSVLQGLDELADSSEGGEQRAMRLQLLNQQVQQVLTASQALLSPVSAEHPLRLELHWAAQVLPGAVTDVSQPDRYTNQSLGSLRTHMANAERYLQRHQEQLLSRGPFGLKRIYESDQFVWAMAGVNLIAVAWVVRLLLRRRVLTPRK